MTDGDTSHRLTPFCRPTPWERGKVPTQTRLAMKSRADGRNVYLKAFIIQGAGDV